MIKSSQLSALTFLLPLAIACGSRHVEAPASSGRVVAIGDLHGDLDNAVRALGLAGVVDGDGHWTGGTATLVQTGDVVDRGPDSRAVLDWLSALRTEATAAGGRVVLLLGNHEVMNLSGDLRYVNPLDTEAFGGAEARALAFAPDGVYGRELRQHDAVAQVGDAIFVHGGLHPIWARLGVDGVNQRVHEALAGGDDAVLGQRGPLWLRDLVELPEAQACPLVAQSLASLNAKRMIVGHTAQRSGQVASRCGGALQVIDTGISDSYGGNLSVWEESNFNASAVYSTGAVDLPDPS